MAPFGIDGSRFQALIDDVGDRIEARSGDAGIHLKAQALHVHIGAPWNHSPDSGVWIDDRRPGAVPRTEFLFLRGSMAGSEHCFRESPVMFHDDLIRCCSFREREYLSVLRYTRPVEHGGEGWLLVTIRFEYRGLLARLKG
jgi:hypothetical protein